MAEKGGSMTIGDPSCAWVRDWLPLLAGDGEEVSGEGGDLGVEDRRRIERHLGGCAPCRRHRAALEGALSILGAVAFAPPVEPAAGSVWPALEGRIRRHHERERPVWMAALRAACPAGVRSAADRIGRGWEEIRGQLPFRAAWAWDSAGEFLETRLRGLALRPVLPQADLNAVFTRLAFSLGVAFLVFLVVAPTAHHRQTRAEAQIAANAVPLPDAGDASPVPPEPAEAAGQ